MSIRLVLIRHGESTWNAARIWQGHANAPLTERGRDQAREAAAALAGESFAGLYASDLRRALETARIVGAPHGRVPEVDRRLRELYLGEWEGLGRDAITAGWPDRLARFDARDPDASAPGGESRRQLATRVFAALDDLAARHDEGEQIVVVAHGGVLAAVFGEERPENAAIRRGPWPRNQGLAG